jgi:hypothetical protein
MEAGTPGGRPVSRVGARPAAAEPIRMAIDGGGCARQATGFACRRATSRCRTYLHGASSKRGRRAGDPFRASARRGRCRMYRHGAALRGDAGQATRFACRRATSRCRTYRHGD